MWAAVSAGCGGSRTQGAQDPTRQAETEYDLARDLWLQRGQPREALNHALKAIELDEQNAEAQHLVALLYLDFCARSALECRLPQAEKHARAALDQKPDLREARNTLGVILIHAHRPRDAIQVLKPLSDDILYQTPEKAWGNLGWAYLESGQLELAEDALRRSIAAQPLFCVGSYRLGLVYEKRMHYPAALDALTRALETEAPECSRLQDAFSARARVLAHLGRTPESLSDLERCVELSQSTETGKNCRSMLQKLK
ncbi:MAG TPA: tetratricopeptide repeat protein [Polyangiaceae bacterium]|nr:tetratricopeptide repeat protein [Polyangiaceae bacterium]